MTSNFSSKFTTLRKERKLSIRDISLMTGVSTKEVKKWEKGTAIPNGSRIASALEGLLGEDICKDFSFMEDQVMDGNLRGKPFRRWRGQSSGHIPEPTSYKLQSHRCKIPFHLFRHRNHHRAHCKARPIAPPTSHQNSVE